MATSGTSTFNLTRDQIIRAALRKVGAIQAGETPNAQLISDCAEQLNSMVKFWMTSGIHIWTESEAIMYTTLGQSAYPLGTGTPTSVYTITTTTVSTAASILGATVIPIATNYLMTNGGIIGVALDDGTVQWGTIVSSTAVNVTISPGLVYSAQANLPVYVATNGIVRPLRIPAARRWDSLSQTETPMTALSRLDYQALPNKTLKGTVTQWFYDPRGGANATGMLHLWPTPSSVKSNNVKFTWYRPIQDFNSPGDNADLPQEWVNTLVWNLALHMAPEFGPPPDVYAMIKEFALATFEESKGWDREPESVNFGVDFSRMGR